MSFFITKRNITTIPPEHIEEYGVDIAPSFIPYNYSIDRITNMKYIVATSDTPYFRWQMLVQINNFISAPLYYIVLVSISTIRCAARSINSTDSFTSSSDQFSPCPK